MFGKYTRSLELADATIKSANELIDILKYENKILKDRIRELEDEKIRRVLNPYTVPKDGTNEWPKIQPYALEKFEQIKNKPEEE